ncbi:MAG: hypothetical protein NC906_07950, partial [Candidatus Omnitrophica bacterium]|nr:hypothetical protein [Candidatus Omnitrophota bacterium]
MKRILWLFFVMGAIFCFSQTQKLVFHLTFENDEIKDVVGNKTGVANGGKFTDGKLGKGYYFDGKERQTDCIVFK